MAHLLAKAVFLAALLCPATSTLEDEVSLLQTKQILKPKKYMPSYDESMYQPSYGEGMYPHREYDIEPSYGEDNGWGSQWNEPSYGQGSSYGESMRPSWGPENGAMLESMGSEAEVLPRQAGYDYGGEMNTAQSVDLMDENRFAGASSGKASSHSGGAVSSDSSYTLDHNQILDAFGANSERAKNQIANKAKKQLEMLGSAKKERQSGAQKAQKEIAQAQKNAQLAIKARRKGVQQAQQQAIQVRRAAQTRVRQAKQAEVENKKKLAEARTAASLGRQVGAKQGADEARHMQSVYKMKMQQQEMKQQQKTKMELEKQQLKMKQFATLEQMKKKQTADELAMKTMSEKAKDALRATKKKFQSEVDKVEGPSGVESKMIARQLGQETNKYDKATAELDKEMEDIAAGSNSDD